MKKKILITIIVLLIVVLCTYIGILIFKRHRQNTNPVSVYALDEYGDSSWYEEEVSSMSGTVSSTGTQKVYCDAGKKIKEFKVKIGDNVKPGDELFVYDETESDLALESLRSDLEVTKSELADAYDELNALKKKKPVPETTEGKTETTTENNNKGGKQEKTTKKTTEKTTAKTTEKTTVTTTEATTQATTQVTTEATTQATTEATTQATTEPASDNPDSPSATPSVTPTIDPDAPSVTPTADPDVPSTEDSTASTEATTENTTVSTEATTVSTEATTITTQQQTTEATTEKKKKKKKTESTTITTTESTTQYNSPSDDGDDINLDDIDDDDDDEDDDGEEYTKYELSLAIKRKNEEIKSIENEIASQELAIKKQEKAKESEKIISKIKGKITEVNSPTDASQEVYRANPAIVIDGNGTFIATVSVGEYDLAKMTLGTDVTVYCYDTGSRYAGKVVDIGINPVGESNFPLVQSKYPVKVSIDSTAEISDGSYVEVSLKKADDTFSDSADFTDDSNSFDAEVISTGTDADAQMNDMFSVLEDEEEDEYLDYDEEEEYDAGDIVIPLYLVKQEGSRYFVYKEHNGRLKKQYINTGKIYNSTDISVTGGISSDDWVAFPYDKNCIEGKICVHADSEDLY